MSSKSSSTVRYHPLSLEYLWLKLVALLLRATVAWTYRSEIPDQRALIPAGVTVSRIKVPSRDEGRSIVVDVYSRETTGDSSGPRAVHLNFHGSGFVVPWLGSDTAFCARVAAEADVVVLDCDYRKAPEAPFPAAHNDTHDVFDYVLTQPTSFDPTRITASGFSAGASLALTLSTTVPPSSLADVISFYGNMTPSLPPLRAPSSSSSSQTKDGMVITPSSRTFFYKSLLLPGVDPRDPRLNATVAQTERWPEEVLFVCGEADDLWRGAKEVSERLEREGAKVGFVSVQGAAHGFDKKVKGMSGETRRKVDEAYGEAIELVRRCGRKE